MEYNQLMSPRGNGIDVKFIKFLNSRGPKLISYNAHYINICVMHITLRDNNVQRDYQINI